MTLTENSNPTFKPQHCEKARKNNRGKLQLCIIETKDSENIFPAGKTESCKGNFEKLLIEAVDDGFSSLGESCKQAIYFHLENTFKIKRQEIPSKIEDFAKAIEQIFGPGAKLIEIEIMKVLRQKVEHFKYFPKQEDIIFTEYIATLRCFS